MDKRIERIVNILDEKKAEDIETFDLTGKDYLVSHVVIATALNNKHSLSLINTLKEDLKPHGEEILRTEEDGDWSIVDLGDMLIHVMTESYREKYSLENFLESFKAPKED